MRARWVAVVAVVVLTAAACSNSSSGKAKTTTTTAAGGAATSIKPGNFPAVNQPGVTPTEIRVSGVAAMTNPLGGQYGTAFDGVQAYFNMVNARGGIYGRKLVLVGRHDDNFSQNAQTVNKMVLQDNAFAVLPVATTVFSGASVLAENHIPTFGWGINPEWWGPSNLFAQALYCFEANCPSPVVPYIAQKLGKKRVGLLGYNVASSAGIVDADKASLQKYPTAKAVYVTKSLSFGVTDMSADVKKMVDAKVDLVAPGMDNNGILTLAREMRQQGLNAPIVLPNAYDHDFMAKNGGFFQGSIVTVQEAPMETTPKFEALQDFTTWMDKGGYKKTENAEVGWVNADALLTGLRAAGPDFTRQKVVDGLNRLTNYDAGGLVAPLDWTKQHTDKQYPRVCLAFVRVDHSKFVPTWGEPGKPFTCWNATGGSFDVSKPYALQ